LDYSVSCLLPFPVAQPDGDDEIVFNDAANLLPLNFTTASFLTPEMVKYHRNEHERPGYRIACILHNAFALLEDVSQMRPEEVQFHVDACRLCIELTCSNVSTLGFLLDKIITYVTCVPLSGVQSRASLNEFINCSCFLLHQKLPQLQVNNMPLVWDILGESFHDIESKASSHALLIVLEDYFLLLGLP
jgi:hypothetical protein